MPERNMAILNVGKALLGASFATIAAIGSASGIGWIAGVTALPAAAMPMIDTIKANFLKEKTEQLLVIPMPRWWTGDAAVWQTICAEIEQRLSAIMNALAERLRKEHEAPTRTLLRRALVDEIALQLPVWEVTPQERSLVAEYVASPLLEKVSVVFQAMLNSLREEAMATSLNEVVALLNTLTQKQQENASPLSNMPLATRPQQQSAGAQDTPSTIEMLKQKIQQNLYDVYICYNEADEAEVMAIGEQLKAHGVLPWFDVIDAQPGTSLQTQQGEQIRTIKSAAVFIGKNPVVDWQEMLTNSFIEQFVQRKIPVIPVLLASAPQKPILPVFLATMTWVDFHKLEQHPLERLVWALPESVRLYEA